MKTNHMIGITPAHDAPRFDMLRDLGVQWVRQGYVFPFAERGSERPSDAFLRSEEQVETYLREGFQVLASLPRARVHALRPGGGKDRLRARHARVDGRGGQRGLPEGAV